MTYTTVRLNGQARTEGARAGMKSKLFLDFDDIRHFGSHQHLPVGWDLSLLKERLWQEFKLINWLESQYRTNFQD